MEYVEGTPLHKLRDALSIDEQRAIDREAIGYLRQMNEIAADSFGYLAPAAWDPGTRVEVEIHGKRVEAETVKGPFRKNSV